MLPDASAWTDYAVQSYARDELQADCITYTQQAWLEGPRNASALCAPWWHEVIRVVELLCSGYAVGRWWAQCQLLVAGTVVLQGAQA